MMNRDNHDTNRKNYDHIESLAVKLIEKRSKETPLIIPFVGAGASKPAGLPVSSGLRDRLYQALVQDTSPNDPIKKLLDMEALYHFPKKSINGILKLSLFEFVTVISQFEYGRDTIAEVIQTTLSQPTKRPLSYELLSHLAKHKFIDHFVSMNFDNLLDEALNDEIPERLKIIGSSSEVPGPRSSHLTKDISFLIKPFGSLALDRYKLLPSELNIYGSNSVWSFLLKNIFNKPTGDRKPDIIIILVGYAGAEEAFDKLITELKKDKGRNVEIYSIDPRKTLESELIKFEAKHIQMDADNALSLLIEILRYKILRYEPNKVWIPVARHYIISKYFKYHQLQNPSLRIKLEIILQTLKSRGVSTVEALSKISRISNFSDEAFKSISDLKHKDILSVQVDDQNSAQFIQKYTLSTTVYEDLADQILSLAKFDSNVEFNIWTVNSCEEDKLLIQKDSKTPKEFLTDQLKEIARGPEVEISLNVSPSSKWMFSNPKLLKSLDDLTVETAKLFSQLHRYDEKVNIFGVWATGEWLFHTEGWARHYGDIILERLDNGKADLFMIVIKPLKGNTLQRERANYVTDTLIKNQKHGKLEIYEMDIWNHNRRFTIVEFPGSEITEGGIYMQRRHSNSLVAPVKVQGKDIRMLRKIFNRYKEKAIKVYPREIP